MGTRDDTRDQGGMASTAAEAAKRSRGVAMVHNDQGFARPTLMPRRTTPMPIQAMDRRADGQARSVSVSRDVIRIDRSLQGVVMRLAVPVRAYRGVALMLRPDADGALPYCLHLLHRDSELSVTLDQAADDSDIVADWRLWSRFFRLPALVERRPGSVVEADASLGALLLGDHALERRASRFASKRHSRFSRLRKMGIAAERPVMHVGERELIARR